MDLQNSPLVETVDQTGGLKFTRAVKCELASPSACGALCQAFRLNYIRVGESELTSCSTCGDSKSGMQSELHLGIRWWTSITLRLVETVGRACSLISMLLYYKHLFHDRSAASLISRLKIGHASQAEIFKCSG